MLWALLFGYFFLGRSSVAFWLYGDQTTKQMQKQLAQIEPDKAGRKAASLTLDQIQSESDRWRAVRTQFSKDVFATLARHDATPADFATLEWRADAINSASTKAFLDLRFKLREQLSETQWRSLFNGPR